MKEIKNDIIRKYEYVYIDFIPMGGILGSVAKNEKYVVYIKETKNEYECYLQNEKYGAINFMFGIYKDHNSIKDFIDMVESNIEDYIKIYKNDYEY